MAIRASHRVVLLLSAVVLAAGAVMAQDKPATPDPPPGHLLVASEGMRDPRFRESVILLLVHDRRGAFGLIINRPLGEHPLAALLDDAGDDRQRDGAVAKADGAIRVFYGGPVRPELGFVVHGAGYRRPETLVGGDFAMTASKDILRDIGQRQGPDKYLLALGYAGWGAGQLDGEMARGDWHVAPADNELVFDLERDAVWEKARARRIREM